MFGKKKVRWVYYICANPDHAVQLREDHMEKFPGGTPTKIQGDVPGLLLDDHHVYLPVSCDNVEEACLAEWFRSLLPEKDKINVKYRVPMGDVPDDILIELEARAARR